jgi:ABC-type enterochelin transport system permease subunit
MSTLISVSLCALVGAITFLGWLALVGAADDDSTGKDCSLEQQSSND